MSWRHQECAHGILQDSVLEWDFLRTWSPELHHLYPYKLRCVTQTLLLGASQQAAKPQSGATDGPLYSTAA